MTNGPNAPRPGQLWRLPVLAPLLRDRRLSAMLALCGAAQVGLTIAHIGAMPCPFVRVTGLPCPGCGASRACAALCRGRLRSALELHAFAPFFLVAIAMFALAATMPVRASAWLAGLVGRVERRWPIVLILLSGLLLYWALRLIYAPAEVARIVSPTF